MCTNVGNVVNSRPKFVVNNDSIFLFIFRCIIGTVSSVETLATMQKIQALISSNAIDVGPNMREIFYPSSQQAACRPRYFVYFSLI